MPPAASRERLAALGIDVWVRRDRRRDASGDERPAKAVGHGTGQAGVAPEMGRGVPRVRMASGDGDWLLVQEAPWDGRHDILLGDIQATIGSARCRFGQWAHSDSAGVSLEELESRGIRHVLVFGEAPEPAAGAGVHLAPDLPRLAASAEARRRLWQLLAGEVGD